ncbi:MAG: hypothetical protein JXO44_12075 [Clostridia bacterium]|nr:hypothetical protein [Clostridia bacterium]
MKYTITNCHNKNHGIMEGTIEDLLWSAEVHQTPVDKGLEPDGLRCGRGHIAKLFIYQIEEGVGGNPNLPSMSTKRITYVNYNYGWVILNRHYEDMTKELVAYIERRLKICLIR